MIPDLLDIQLEHSLHGRFDQGWKICQRLLKERPWCNRTKFNAGWFLLRQGKLKEGMELISYGRFEKVFGSGHIGTQAPIYDGRELNKDIVLFHCEGGFGDEIIGIRFCKEISNRGGKVIVTCHSQLKSLFKRVEGIVHVVERDPKVLDLPHSFWIPAMSSELILGYEFHTLPREPYITADEQYIAKFGSIINSQKFRIGIKWAGNPLFEHEQHRLFPPSLMFDLVNTFPQFQFYSLQKDRQIHLPEIVHDLDPYLETWEDTAAAIQHLDLVITSCTGVAHLAAAIGKLTWIIAPILSYYIWAFPREPQEGLPERTWYYDSARLFRQQEYGAWNHPFDNIKRALELIC